MQQLTGTQIDLQTVIPNNSTKFTIWENGLTLPGITPLYNQTLHDLTMHMMP